MSLRGFVEEVRQKCSILAGLEGDNTLGDLILKVGCLHQNKRPKGTYYMDLDYNILMSNRELLINGFKLTENLVINERVWDSRWLPSTVPFRVLPLLLCIKHKREKKHEADSLLKRYLWLSFLTKWYSVQANDRLYNDYLYLRNELGEEVNIDDIPKLSETVFSKHKKLPTIDAIMKEKLSKKARLSKSILAISVRTGANGLETNAELTFQSQESRDLHHIYAKKLLGKEANVAINCMMLEEEANRSWGGDWPGDYLSKRIKSRYVTKREMKARLESHVLPVNNLFDAKEPTDTRNKNKLLKDSFKLFVKERAKLIQQEMKKLICSQ